MISLALIWQRSEWRFLISIQNKEFAMCYCDRSLTRRDLMRGAMAMGTVAAAGSLDLITPSQALAAVPEPRI